MKLPIVPWIVIATAVVLTVAVAILRLEHVENAAGLVLVAGINASASVGMLVFSLSKR